MELATLHNTYQLHLVWKWISYQKLKGAQLPCTNWGAWSSWTSRDYCTSISETNIEFSGFFSWQHPNGAQWREVQASIPSMWHALQIFTCISRGEFGWHGTFSRLIHQANHYVFFSDSVLLMWHHFDSKEVLVHSSSAIVLQTYLLILVAKGLWEQEALEISPTVSHMDLCSIMGYSGMKKLSKFRKLNFLFRWSKWLLQNSKPYRLNHLMYLYLFRNMYKKTLAVSALPFHTCVVFPCKHTSKLWKGFRAFLWKKVKSLWNSSHFRGTHFA